MKNVLDTIESFRELIKAKSWFILNEKEIHYDDYQFLVSDRKTKTHVTFFSSGKITIQGNTSTLQSEINAWREQLPIRSPLYRKAISTVLHTTKSSVLKVTNNARMGVQQYGINEYFGPLVVTAIYINQHVEAQLMNLKLSDSMLLSDSIIISLAEEIKLICRGKGIVRSLLPARYNELHAKKPDLNYMLAELQAQVVANLKTMFSCEIAIVEQLSDKLLIGNVLKDIGCTIALEQHTYTEDVAIAAAAILARAEFVKILQSLSNNFEVQLLNRASEEEIISLGHKIAANKGHSVLAQVAKLHFQTMSAILKS